MVLGYLLLLLLASIAGDGPRRAQAIGYVLLDLAAFVSAMVLARGGALEGVSGALVYRGGLVAGIFGSFAHLQYVLPTARSVRLDADIRAFDLAVFSVEPAEVFDRFVSPATTEWFSFFYFGYFFLVAGHALVFMFACRDRALLAEFSLGFLSLFCIGHLVYMVVPGHGPYWYLDGRWAHPLEGPFWWKLVLATVSSAEVSARTDIFPSLHTAAPTFLALFAYRRRQASPFRYGWVPLAVFASQIVLSTMFLRWHYLADVVAGLALAAGAEALSPRIVRWEQQRRARAGQQPVWTAPWPVRRPA